MDSMIDKIRAAEQQAEDIRAQAAVDARDMGARAREEATERLAAAAEDERQRTRDALRRSREEIERMKKEAEEHAEEDKKALEDAAKLNSADAYAFMVEKTIGDLEEGKITEEQHNELKEKIKAVKDAVNEKNVLEAESRMGELEKVWNPIAEGLYKDAASSGFTGGGTGNNPFSGFNPNGQGPNPFENAQ